MLDMSSAWVSQYVLHPSGTAEVISGHSDLSEYFEYFVECEVFIPHTLPLGPFPIRTGANNGQGVVYPTEVGIYRSAYLWRIQIEDCRKAGCLVYIKRGYAWREYTDQNTLWSGEAYKLRIRADSEFIRKQSKAINVSAIGRMFRSREGYILIGKETCGEGRPLVNSNREPINLYVEKEVDNRSAFMVHWYAYTIAQCNSNVYNFALPYAKEGRLVAIDYDSVMVLETSESYRYIRKQSFEALQCPPGTWLYMQLHNVHVLNHRSFKSDEITKMPGVVR
jgi:hypothetical protein